MFKGRARLLPIGFVCDDHRDPASENKSQRIGKTVNIFENLHIAVENSSFENNPTNNNNLICMKGKKPINLPLMNTQSDG